jgi:hypothetical protein
LTDLPDPVEFTDVAGIAQLVEHNLAKVGVASSSLVSRSIVDYPLWNIGAEWQSGYAAACKAVDVGSIPASASTSRNLEWILENISI